MIDDTPPPTLSSPREERTKELKKMELCVSCVGIQRNWAKHPGTRNWCRATPATKNAATA